ncbi:MAG: hypothetical protein K2X77_26095 [Candidatus Obscuribacterales bacterium]|nr:hypothetical protein [Candidatus Obscuribacterales bacterium]
MNSHDRLNAGNKFQSLRNTKASGNSRAHIAQAGAIRAAAEDKMALEKAERIIASMPVKLNNAVVDGKQSLLVMPVDGFDITMKVPSVVQKVMDGLSQFGVHYKIERRPDPGFPASHYLVARW